MAILSGNEIRRQVETGRITIDPFDPKLVNPNSVDVRLGDELLTYRTYGGFAWHGLSPDRPSEQVHVADLHARYDPYHYEWSGSEPSEWIWLRDQKIGGTVLDVARPNATVSIPIPAAGLILLPGILYLGGTVEMIGSDRYAATVEGKSSLGRLGLTLHVTAGWIDVGFRGVLTLEITVVHPLRIYPGMRIGQVGFHEVAGEVTPYSGKYGGRSVEASKAYEDFGGA